MTESYPRLNQIAFVCAFMSLQFDIALSAMREHAGWGSIEFAVIMQFNLFYIAFPEVRRMLWKTR